MDAKDREILRALQADGRLTHPALAERVALSPRACLDRVRRLERERRIVGYRALVAREAVDAAVAVHTEVVLVDQRQATLAQFERRVLQCPEVVACHLVSGPFDYLVRLACRDLDHYQRISDAWINDLSMGVARIVSHTELRAVKEFAGWPL